MIVPWRKATLRQRLRSATILIFYNVIGQLMILAIAANDDRHYHATRSVNICFHINGAERGCTWSTYDYAHYTEEILQLRSVILYPRMLRVKDKTSTTNSSNGVAEGGLVRFETRFGDRAVPYGDEDGSIIGGASLIAAAQSQNCSLLYMQKFGLIRSEPNFPESFPENIPTAVHAVFRYEKHGTYYASLNQNIPYYPPFNCGLTDLDRCEDIEVLHHIIPASRVGLSSVTYSLSLRKELGIPADAFVVCNHGGRGSFDVEIAANAVNTLITKYNSSALQFLFLGTLFYKNQTALHFLPQVSSPASKERFFEACNCMLHARTDGETFGIAVAEFSIRNKPVLTWTGDLTMHAANKEHIRILGRKGHYYSSSQDIVRIISEWIDHGIPDRNYNAHKEFSPEIVMQEFKRIFLKDILLKEEMPSQPPTITSMHSGSGSQYSTFRIHQRRIIQSAMFSNSHATPTLVDLRVSFPLRASLFASSVDHICSSMRTLGQGVSWQIADCSHCMQRILRLQVLSQAKALSRDFRDLPYDTFESSIIYSHHFYSGDDFSGKKVCVVGWISMQSLISLLIMNPSSEVMYLPTDDLRNHSLFQNLQQLLTVFSNFYIHKEGSDNIECFVLHISRTVKNVGDLRALLQRVQLLQTRHIIWENTQPQFVDIVVKYAVGSPYSIEFDSVGHWYAGKIQNNNKIDAMGNALYNTCAQYSTFVEPMNEKQPIQILMGSVRNEDQGRPRINCRKENAIFITYESRAFIDMADSFAEALRRAGFEHVEQMGRYNRTEFLRLRKEYCKSNLLQLALDGHRGLHVFTGRYIVVHTGSDWDGSQALPHYRHVVNHAAAVLVHSHAHFEDVQSMGREDGIFLVPVLATTAAARGDEHNLRLSSDDARSVPNDLLVLPTSESNRSVAMLNQLLRRTTRDRVSVIHSSHQQTLQIDWADHQTLEFLSLQSKILLNFHEFEDSVLETLRINKLLSLGVCVVSEHSYRDPFLDAEYADTIYFGCNVDDMYDIVKALLADGKMLRDCYKRSVAKVLQLANLADGLVEAVVFAYGSSASKLLSEEEDDSSR